MKSQKVKFIETESRMMVSQGKGWGYKVSVIGGIISSRDLMHSAVSIVNNMVFYTRSC